MNADNGTDCSDGWNGSEVLADISRLVFNGTPKEYWEPTGVLLTKKLQCPHRQWSRT